jgi:hypothetical protein
MRKLKKLLFVPIINLAVEYRFKRLTCVNICFEVMDKCEKLTKIVAAQEYNATED